MQEKQTGSGLIIDIFPFRLYVSRMARKPRIEFNGALYHVVARGNRKETIFRSKEDYERYRDLLLRYKKKYHYKLYAFALMPNHLHLLMETADIHLSKIMQGLQQSYTAYFNRKYELVGHLFQGRYKAILCDGDAYLMTLIKYVHLNPVRAKLGRRPDEYLWSSHHAYLGHKDILVDSDFVLHFFDPKKVLAVRRYQDFMNDSTCADRKEIYGTIDQRFLGDDKFVDAIVDRTKTAIKNKKKPRRHSFEQILAVVETITSISQEEIRSKGKSREISRARTIFCRVALNFSYKVKEIAAFLGKDPSAISRYPVDEESTKDEAGNVIRALESENVNNQA
jgi:REP element-mobilizing transposase RayT